MTKVEKFADDLDHLIIDSVRGGDTVPLDYLYCLAAVYTKFCRIAENGKDAEAITELRAQCMQIVDDYIYGDGLLDESGFSE